MRRLAELFWRVTRTSLAYPIYTVWMAGVIAILGVSQGWWELAVAIGLFSMVTLLVFLGILKDEVQHEMISVHTELETQRQELLAQIEELVDLLKAAGVQVPTQGSDAGEDTR